MIEFIAGVVVMATLTALWRFLAREDWGLGL